MIVKVRMLAFQDGEIREVNIPDIEAKAAIEAGTLADSVFHWGQNDVQSIPGRCSVSVGDVIEMPDGKLLVVAPFGFRDMTPEQFEEYKKVPRRDRSFSEYVRPKDDN